MIFNSITFLIFFFLFFNLYWLINNRAGINLRNTFIVLASYLFYGWWDWRFLSLIVLSSIVDYVIGWQLGKVERPRSRKYLLGLSLLVNLGVLGFFKYFNFFVASFQDLLSVFSLTVSLPVLQIILPVGISFYTFQTLSYTIDIYRRQIKPERNVFAFFAFVSFFPQLVAGPIERASQLLPQFLSKKQFDYHQSISGLRLILWGLFKKVVIADNFGVLADQCLAVEHTVSGVTTLVGTLFFALQIYADFSGYSDMAIGLARLLGFQLRKNFLTPYFSGSFTEFWRRGHISLSTWFRDYVYIPLGGSRVGDFQIYRNIFLTFVLSGLWHGAKVTFLIWGALHGVFLMIEKKIGRFLPRPIGVPLVFIMVVLLWLPFRAEQVTHLWRLTQSIFDFKNYSLGNVEQFIYAFSITRFMTLLFVFVGFWWLESRFGKNDFSEWISGRRTVFRVSIYYILLLLILFLGNFSVKPSFIYFQF